MVIVGPQQKDGLQCKSITSKSQNVKHPMHFKKTNSEEQIIIVLVYLAWKVFCRSLCSYYYFFILFFSNEEGFSLNLRIA